jgi:uncharacterized membrane protein
MIAVIFGVLLLVHIAAVIGWAGSSFLFSNVIGPSMRLMKPHSRTDFLITVLPKFSRFVLLSALVAIASGLLLAGYVFEVNTSLLPTGVGFVILVFGALAGFFALLIGVVALYPFSEKLSKLLLESAGQEDKGEIESSTTSRIQEIQINISSSGRVVAVLLVIAVIFMALSMYV